MPTSTTSQCPQCLVCMYNILCLPHFSLACCSCWSWKVKGSPKLLQLILRGMWMLIFIAMHPTSVGTFNTKPQFSASLRGKSETQGTTVRIHHEHHGFRIGIHERSVLGYNKEMKPTTDRQPCCKQLHMMLGHFKFIVAVLNSLSSSVHELWLQFNQTLFVLQLEEADTFQDRCQALKGSSFAQCLQRREISDLREEESERRPNRTAAKAKGDRSRAQEGDNEKLEKAHRCWKQRLNKKGIERSTDNNPKEQRTSWQVFRDVIGHGLLLISTVFIRKCLLSTQQQGWCYWKPKSWSMRCTSENIG